MRLLPDTGTEPGPARLHGDWGASGAAHDPSAATETLPPHCRAWRDDARFLQLLLGGDRLQTQARDDQGYIFFHNGLRLEEHHRPENRLDLYTSSFTTLLLPRSRCVCVTSLPQGMLKRPWGQETSQGWGWGVTLASRAPGSPGVRQAFFNTTDTGSGLGAGTILGGCLCLPPDKETGLGCTKVIRGWGGPAVGGRVTGDSARP